MKIKQLSVLVAVFAFAFFAFKANAEVFQFSKTDPKYLQALSVAAAQEAQESINIENKLELDEDLKPEDFGLKNVGILPTNPFYFIKGIRRSAGSIFTRDPAKKAELKLKYAAEKLLEAKEVAQNEDSDDGDKEYAIDNFKDELEEVKHRVEIASESLNDEQSKELSKKVLDATFKYGKSLGNIGKNISPALFDNVKQAKDASSEAFASTFGLTESGTISNQIVEVLDKQAGSEFKDFKNLEVLKEVEGRVPEKAKEAIRVAQDNALNRLQTELEKFEPAKRAIFEEFVKSAGGSEIRHLEIINDLESRPISKDLRDVISGAKEQVFSKAESRLNGLSQENKEKFVEHLGEGNLEDFRILKELQNNISSGVISGISNVASRAETEFIKKIESTGQDEAQKKEFLGSIERFHDAQSISVLNEIEKLIPDDKKSFFAELKSKAVQEIRNDVSRAVNSSQRQSIYDSLAGDHPEEFAALDEFSGKVNTPFDINALIEGIKNAQYGIMQNRIERISDKDRLEKYEKEFRQEIPDYALFNRFFEKQKVIFESPEKALKKIEEAEKAIAEFKGIRASLPYDTAYKGGEFDNTLRDIEGILAHAERRLDTARTVLGYNDIGRAFGEAQSAENIARDGIALANKYKSGVKETRCPFYFSPPPRFCENGVLVYQNDQNGCALPPRCEFKETQECPVVDYSTKATCPLGTHRESFKDEKGCFTLGKCVPDRVTCQAYFEGYVFDKSLNSCRKESSGGCSDPFVYHALDECTKAHTKTGICPAMPTVTSCPAGEHKIVTFNSPECGIYYGCEKDITITTPQCADGKDNDNDGQTDYPADTGCYGKEDYDEAYGQTTGGYCGDKICQNSEQGGLCNQDCVDDTNTNWTAHIWNFADGTLNSMILNRTDSEYTSFIKSVSAQCEKISKSKFVWRPGGGNDSPDNWQNFGIPDCSGTGVNNYVCGNNVCDSGETSTSCPADCGSVGPSCGSYTTTANCEANPACDWSGSSCIPTTTTMTCNNNKICEYNESQTSCPSDCTSATARCTYYTETTCNADTICAWVTGFGCGSKAQCNDKLDNDNDGLIDMADSGCTDNFDNDEAVGGTTTIKPQCSDGKDNDNDGLVDYPADKSCFDGTDNDEAYPPTCTTASACVSTESCTASGFYWHNGLCRESKPIDGSCAYSYNYCINETECLKNNYYWCRNTCYGDKSACPTTTTTTTTTTATCSTASACTSSSSCSASNFFWYNNICNNSPQTTTTTTTARCTYYTETTCNADTICAWVTGFGCGSKAQCNDKLDNDNDSLIDMADSGCTDNFDNDESGGSGGSTTSCVSCSSPGSGCWYEGGSCSTCGTVKCSTTSTTSSTACNNNGTCESGESSGSCPSDCSGSTTGTTCSSGQYWNGTACVANTTTSSGCSTPSNCFNQSTCTSSGWYWYSSGCWSSPQTSGGASVLQGFWNILLGQ